MRTEFPYICLLLNQLKTTGFFYHSPFVSVICFFYVLTAAIARLAEWIGIRSLFSQTEI